MKRFTASLAAVGLLLAGCGGGGHKSHTTTQPKVLRPAAAVNAQSQAKNHPPQGVTPCEGKNYTLQCATGAPGATLPPQLRKPQGIRLFGIDFAWGGPYGSTAKANGAHFGISYLSGTSKDWSSSRAHSYTSVGLGVVFVWETTANRALSSCAGGSYDASRAYSEESALGYRGTPVYAAVDFDTSGFSTYGSVGSYLKCFNQRLGGKGGAYGGYNTMAIAHANGVHYLWQTLAWSYGHLYSGVQLYQYSINDSWHGYSVDYNWAFQSDYGQAGGHRPPPPPPDPYRFYPKTVFKLKNNQKGSEYKTVKLWDSAGCANPVSRKVCKSTLYHLKLERDRDVFIAHHKPEHKGKKVVWVKVSKARYGVDHLGTRIHGLQTRIHAKKPCSVKTCG